MYLVAVKTIFQHFQVIIFIRMEFQNVLNVVHYRQVIIMLASIGAIINIWDTH